MKKSQSFLTGALVLSVGGLLAKILGALYRIPLTNVLGSYGMGLYQLVFPPYILFLTVAQAGVPTAISKLIAQHNQQGCLQKSRGVFRLAFWLLAATGGVCALLMAALAPLIAAVQGNADTAPVFLIVAPALLFVPVTNVLKGYFQGNMNMVPSGVTTVFEQIVKLAVGLFCAIRFMPNVQKAVMGAVFAITASELSSLVVMSGVFLVHRAKQGKHPPLALDKVSSKQLLGEIFGLAFPVALGGFAMQLSQVMDSVMVVNLLTVPNATQMYGLWTGPVNSMLGLPIALSGGVAVSALPGITKAFCNGDGAQLNASFNSAIKLTLVISLPCAMGIMALSRPILSLLYGGLPTEEIGIAALLLTLSGPSIVLLAVVQTCVSVCQAVGKPYATVVFVSLAIVVKGAVNLFLLPNKQINIFGAAISETLCYLFAAVCVIIYLRKKVGLQTDIQSLLKPMAASLCMTLLVTVAVVFAQNILSSKAGTLLLIAICGIFYFAMLWVLKVFTKEEVGFLPTKKSRMNL